MLRAQLLATLLALWLAATQLLKSDDDLLGIRAVLYKLVVLVAWVGNDHLLSLCLSLPADFGLVKPGKILIMIKILIIVSVSTFSSILRT